MGGCGMLTLGRVFGAANGRYDRIAPLYDLIEGVMETARFKKWRPLLWAKVEGPRILEVGVGTGRNFPYYPADVDVTAIDFSGEMLKRARNRARRQNRQIRLEQMDVQNLELGDSTFDTVVSSFVFCSVRDPIRGLREVERVCKPGGKVILLEHVLSTKPIARSLMNIVNPLAVRILGENINRRTVENVKRSGLVVEKVTDLGAGIFKLIEARRMKPS
jgi:ubiquinone/menaquinone biosynthesis C-methylase UbiE